MISIQNLHFSYTEREPVLQGISLNVRSGERVALIGGNGSGKTTLARHVNGLLRSTTGEVFVNNHNTARLSVATLARQVAFVFQNPDDQICKRRVWDEVAFGAVHMGYDQAGIRALTEQALAWLDLLDHAEMNPHDLSLAWRRRVSIASALAMDTPILILDEPTVNQDSFFHQRLIALLDDLQAKGKTVLVICHDMDFVAENFARVVLLKDGRIMQDGLPEEVFRHADIICQAHLQVPQLVRLAQALGWARPSITPIDFINELNKRIRS